MIEGTASKSFAEMRSGERSRILTTSTPLVWLNLLCLDAPIVAVSWLMIFARSFGVPIARGGIAALFLTAWLIYLADRFGDSLAINPTWPTSLRQRFCLHHNFFWLGLIVVVGLADLFFVVRQLDRRVFFFGAILSFFALGYLVANQVRPSLWQRLPLKEISIGSLFAAGTIVPIGSRLTSAAAPGWLLFAILCALNCICIAVWERDLDQRQARVSISTEFPAMARALMPALGMLVSLAAAVAISSPSSRELACCIGASAILLGGTHFFREKIQPDLRTALADLVLLTPLVALVF